ncbi:MAG: hypothetical protein ABSA70_06575 [Terriglobia bacterium]
MGFETAFHFFEANGLFLAAFGDHSQVVKVFEQSLVTGDGKNHPLLLSLVIYNVLRARCAHFVLH